LVAVFYDSVCFFEAAGGDRVTGQFQIGCASVGGGCRLAKSEHIFFGLSL
jgi:hypothetical protein